jgi:hypothetical protein
MTPQEGARAPHSSPYRAYGPRGWNVGRFGMR